MLGIAHSSVLQQEDRGIDNLDQPLTFSLYRPSAFSSSRPSPKARKTDAAWCANSHGPPQSESVIAMDNRIFGFRAIESFITQLCCSACANKILLLTFQI